NHDARQGFFADVTRKASRPIVLSEGLLIYLMADEVAALARDLARGFDRWIIDLVSPGLLAMIKDRAGAMVQQARAPFLFGPPEGPAFFDRYGWQLLSVKSLLKTAASIHRLPLFLRMLAMLPDSPTPGPSRPWGGVCLLGNADRR